MIICELKLIIRSPENEIQDHSSHMSSLITRLHNKILFQFWIPFHGSTQIQMEK